MTTAFLDPIDDSADPRIQRIVDDRLMDTYWGAAKHFGTQDLVVFFDETDEDEPISILPRTRIDANAKLPEVVKSKVRKPATEATTRLSSSDAAFWLVAVFTDETSFCVAIKAKLQGTAGHA